MIKNLPRSLLEEYGWTRIDVGRGSIVSYCKTCKSKRLHYCNGKKKIVGDELLRFVCETCNHKLNGNRRK
jgi:hypothetical protein